MDDLDLRAKDELAGTLADKLGKGGFIRSRHTKAVSADSDSETEIEVGLVERLRDVKLGGESDLENVPEPQLVCSPDLKHEGDHCSRTHTGDTS